ncbi:MAG: thrombospondin type 3 repeat-containing protein, partial [Phycisphaerae bacterium]
VPDECDLADGTSADCNANDRPDLCDIALGDSPDCDGDAQPDPCQSDIDADGIIDPCDNCPRRSNPTQGDIDADGIGDLCDTTPLGPTGTGAVEARGRVGSQPLGPCGTGTCSPGCWPVVGLGLAWWVRRPRRGLMRNRIP